MQPPRVLIVEDQYFVAVDCEEHLRGAGFECIGLATTAAEAVTLAERGHPDLIIMDIRLADENDGVQAAILIYHELGIRSIFASGHADSVVRKAAESAHPFGWLDKPYTGDELIRAAREAITELGRKRPARSGEVHEVQVQGPSIQ
jgi:DNA-binding NarL/FixJ family response regulator